MFLVKTKLGVSSIDSIGLFAAKFIPEYTIVWKFNPCIDLRFCDEKFERLSKCCGEQIRKYSYREIHSGLYVLCGGGDARFFNHSSKPNCLDFYHSKQQDLTAAGRDINAGEELTCDYSLLTWI